MAKRLDVFKAPLSGISLVEASAGTGKTYNITSLYIRAILEKGLMPAQILVLTFTEDATAELKNRIRTRLMESIDALENGISAKDGFPEELISQSYDQPVEKLKNALYQFDEASIFTIHGFCNRLLNEYSLQFGVDPDFRVLPDQSQLLQDCVDEYWRNLIRSEQTEEDRFLLNFLIEQDFGPDELRAILTEIIDRPYAKLIPDDADLNKMKETLPEFFAAFEKVKQVTSEEIDKLNEILSHEKQYKAVSDARIKLLNYLGDCRGMEFPNLLYVGLLSPLGNSLCEGKRGHRFELPEICNAIQEFCDVGAEFNALKPAYVIESVQEITQKFQQKKQAGNQLSYDDFLIKVNDGLKKDESGNLARILAEKYPIALVDEFQDTDPIQYNIFRQMYHNRENTALFMIGDPKQSIYGFRGADIYTYLKAKDDADEDQSYALNYNYRSNDKMIEAVNDIFSHSDSPFNLDLKFNKAFFPDGGEKIYLKSKGDEVVNSLQCIKLESHKSLTKGASSERVNDALEIEILDLLSGKYTIEGKQVQQNDIAILVRTGKEGEEIQRRLRELGLKSILKSNSSIFDSSEAQELFSVLHAVLKNYYDPGLRAALCTELIGKNAGDIIHLQDHETEWANMVEIVSEVKLNWEKKGIEAALELLNSEFNILQNLARHIDAERRITNWYHLAELLAKAEREQHLYGNNLLKWFYRKINDKSLKKEEDNLRLESDEELIQISTIHTSKGLEYPIVLCPFLWTDPFRTDKRNIFRFYQNDQVHVDINTGFDRPNSQNAHFEEELRESARLFYVAITRAATACYIFLPNYQKLNESAIATVLGEKDFGSILKVLSESDHIQVRNPVSPELPFVNSGNGQSSFTAQEFTRNDLFDFPRILSFSSLTKNQAHASTEFDERDLDEDLEDRVADEENLEKEDRFTFPSGAEAGTFLHQVFEEIDFQNPDSFQTVISDQLRYSGIDLKWESVANDWVKESLEHVLIPPDLCLKGLSENDLLKEMEFHFPVQPLNLLRLWKIIRGVNPENVEQMSDMSSGFMKGYIDLIFRFQGKYYILDYKSNHFGNRFSDYSQDTLQEKMIGAAYDLQYHLYTLALHRLLRQRLGNYDYEGHFGGVIYLFLRGIDKNEPGSGVFFDRPNKGKIEEMDNLFRTGEKV